jgi:hypothetical protein
MEACEEIEIDRLSLWIDELGGFAVFLVLLVAQSSGCS